MEKIKRFKSLKGLLVLLLTGLMVLTFIPSLKAFTTQRINVTYNWSVYNYYGDYWGVRLDYDIPDSYIIPLDLTVPANSYSVNSKGSIDSKVIFIDDETGTSQSVTFLQLYYDGFMPYQGLTNGFTLEFTPSVLAQIGITYEDIDSISVQIVQDTLYNGGAGVPSGYLSYFLENATSYYTKFNPINIIYIDKNEVYDTQILEVGDSFVTITDPTPPNGFEFEGWETITGEFFTFEFIENNWLNEDDELILNAVYKPIELTPEQIIQEGYIARNYITGWEAISTGGTSWVMRLQGDLINSNYSYIYINLPITDISITSSSSVTLYDEETNTYSSFYLGAILPFIYEFDDYFYFMITPELLEYADLPVLKYDSISITYAQTGDYDGGAGVPSDYINFFNEYAVVYEKYMKPVTVNFINNNETYDVQELYSGMPVAPTPPTPPEGYRFLGWYYDNNRGKFDFNTYIDTSALNEDNELYLYARYTYIGLEDFTINYYSEGELINSQVIASGESIPLFTPPEYEMPLNYDFIGWRNPDGELFNNVNYINPSWIDENNEVRFDAQYVNYLEREIIVEYYDQNILYHTETITEGMPVAPLDPTPPEGYEFNGWKTINGDLFSYYYIDNEWLDRYNIGTILRPEYIYKLRLDAFYIVEQISVGEALYGDKIGVLIYDKDILIDTTLYDVGDYIIEPSIPTYDSNKYSFNGWRTHDGTFFNFSLPITEDLINDRQEIILNASYKTILTNTEEIYIQFYGYAGAGLQSFILSNEYAYDVYGDDFYFPVDRLESYENILDNLDGVTPIPEGYTFRGWKYEDGTPFTFNYYSSDYIVDTELDSGSDLPQINIYANIVPDYATTEIYKGIFYDRFQIHEIQLVVGTSFTRPPDPTIPEGYRFLGWKLPDGQLYSFTNFVPEKTYKSDGTYVYNINEANEIIFTAVYVEVGEEIDSGLETPLRLPDSINGLITSIGFNNPFGRIIIFLIFIIGFSILLVKLRANLMIHFIIDLTLTGLFIYLGFLPIYAIIIILLLLLLIAFTTFKQKEGI